MATVSVRVDDSVKKKAQQIFENIGLTVASATVLFYHQVINYGKIPFEPIAQNDTEYLTSIPNLEQSIVQGLNAPKKKLHKESSLKW
ncbi:antitoxin RelB [Candidatus Termititenax aidoneus]|uniref:Antitoxin RelB n=1 Tax=Termititenax aidoneus TaxID=2218524 RepID=A0A388T8N6_TERA1|nr:antitoxin RelB [Candidatus Termititenax aidoneus]